jgi:hypothetical protein
LCLSRVLEGRYDAYYAGSVRVRVVW